MWSRTNNSLTSNFCPRYSWCGIPRNIASKRNGFILVRWIIWGWNSLCDANWGWWIRFSSLSQYNINKLDCTVSITVSILWTRRSRDCPVGRALTPPTWPGIDSDPVPCVGCMCWLLVLALLRGYFSRFWVVLPPLKPTSPNINSTRIEDPRENHLRLLWLPL